MNTPPTPQQALADTRAWVNRAVIGLNLCPFAKAVQTKGLVRYVHSDATTTDALLDALVQELTLLQATPADQIETTLLVHPQVLQDFFDYNQFLDQVDDAVTALDLDGVLQVASFHPQYQFAGTAVDDIGNATNQSPWPTLHLLREDSIDRAVEAFPDADAIVEANQQTLEALGQAGWSALQSQCRADAAHASGANGSVNPLSPPTP